MSDPGGERQDPRERVARAIARVMWGSPHDPADLDFEAADAAITALPVGGAPRDDGVEALAREIVEEGPAAHIRSGKGYRLAQMVADEFLRGDPRDDQNDDVEAFPNGRGVRWVCDTCGAHTTMTNPESAIKWHEDNLPGHKFLRAVELGPPRAASSSAVSSSGAAPKGEQEDKVFLRKHEERMREVDKAIANARRSPPPDRLTDLSDLSRAIGLAEAIRDLPDDSRIGKAGEVGEEIVDLLEPLRARLADRETEG